MEAACAELRRELRELEHGCKVLEGVVDAGVLGVGKTSTDVGVVADIGEGEEGGEVGGVAMDVGRVAALERENAELRSTLLGLAVTLPDGLPPQIPLPATPPACSPGSLESYMGGEEEEEEERVAEGMEALESVLGVAEEKRGGVFALLERATAAATTLGTQCMGGVDELRAELAHVRTAAAECTDRALALRETALAADARVNALRRHVQVSETRARAAEDRETEALEARASAVRTCATLQSECRQHEAKLHQALSTQAALQQALQDAQEATAAARALTARLHHTTAPKHAAIAALRRSFKAMQASETGEEGEGVVGGVKEGGGGPEMEPEAKRRKKQGKGEGEGEE